MHKLDYTEASIVTAYRNGKRVWFMYSLFRGYGNGRIKSLVKSLHRGKTHINKKYWI